MGLSLGLTGGGGAIFAVPLLVYWIGVDPPTAVAISLITVAATAAVGAVERWRYGQVEIPTGLLFAAAGMLTAPVGSWLGGRIPEQPLLVSFAMLMLVIAVRMWRKARDVEERLPPGRSRRAAGRPAAAILRASCGSRAAVRRCWPWWVSPSGCSRDCSAWGAAF